MKAVLLVCLSAIGCLVLTGGPVRAQQPDEQIKRVFADWEKRREAIKRIRYTVTGQSIKPKGSATDDMGHPLSPPNPPEDIAMRQDSTFVLDLPGNRFRMELTAQKYYQDKKAVIPQVTTTVFDSKTCATEIHREANNSPIAPRQPLEPDVAINRNYARYHPLMTVNSYYLSPLLMAHGLVPRFLEPADFSKPLDPADFTVQGQHLYNGRLCLILRGFPERSGAEQTSFDEYWIDQGRESAVVRQMSIVNDKPMVDIEIAYQQTSHGWLPLNWTGTTRIKGQTVNVTRLRVQEFDIEPAVEDSAFQPEIKPGMIVYETIFEDPEKVRDKPPGYRAPTKTYRVGPDGRWNEMVNGVEQTSHPWLWYGLGGLAAATLIAASVFFYVQRHQRKHAARSSGA